jgi:hypothetical protein
MRQQKFGKRPAKGRRAGPTPWLPLPEGYSLNRANSHLPIPKKKIIQLHIIFEFEVKFCGE